MNRLDGESLLDRKISSNCSNKDLHYIKRSNVAPSPETRYSKNGCNVCRYFTGFHGKSLIIEVCLSRRSGYRSVSFHPQPNLLLLLLLPLPPRRSTIRALLRISAFRAATRNEKGPGFCLKRVN